MNNDLFQQARARTRARTSKAPGCLHAVLAGCGQLACTRRGGAAVPPDRQLPGQAQEPERGHPRLHAGDRRCAYDACGAVNYNLGMAYASLHDYEDAVKHFEIAVSDAKYDASYKPIRAWATRC